MSTVIEAKNLNLWYGAHHALLDVNIEIPEHEITALIGPSGCGKSTFLGARPSMRRASSPKARICSPARAQALDWRRTSARPLVDMRAPCAPRSMPTVQFIPIPLFMGAGSSRPPAFCISLG